MRRCVRYARDLSESQPVRKRAGRAPKTRDRKVTGSTGRRSSWKRVDRAAVKGSLGHTGGLHTVTTGRFTFLQVL